MPTTPYCLRRGRKLILERARTLHGGLKGAEKRHFRRSQRQLFT
jgi:hypothetical protein